MTVTQIDRPTTQEAARHSRSRPAATVLAARVPAMDIRRAEHAAATAALVAAIALLATGVLLAASTSITVSRLHGLVLTAAVASAPFAIAALVYAVHRAIRIAANHGR